MLLYASVFSDDGLKIAEIAEKIGLVVLVIIEVFTRPTPSIKLTSITASRRRCAPDGATTHTNTTNFK